MAIKDEDMKIEEKHLKDTEKWIKEQIESITEDDRKLKLDIDGLRKQLKGKYNQELETKEKLYKMTQQHLEKYIESQERPYFGRIDFREYKRDEETFYIGKFGLGDVKDGDEKVIDWRSPLADLYYSGTFGDVFYRAPNGIISGKLSLKRKFLIRYGKLENAFDDAVNDIILRSSNEEGNALVDEFLRINLEESVSSRLKDVVATIQKEQNDIIRSEKNTALVVQGSAGSGKTTVALHRLAYILYKYKGKLSGNDILVVAPNKLFLDYISEVLPDLGVNNVNQDTFEDICRKILNIKFKIFTKDQKLSYLVEENSEKDRKFVVESSSLRGSILYKNFLDEYVNYMEKEDAKIDDIKVYDYVLFKKEEIIRLYLKDMTNLPINKRKEEIRRYFELKIDNKIKTILDKIDFSYEYLIARIKKSMDDCSERRNKFIQLYNERDAKKKRLRLDARKCFYEYFDKWNGMDTENKYSNFLNDETVFFQIAGGKVKKTIWKFMRDEFNENIKRGILDSDDLASLVYLKFKIEGVDDAFKYKHIVIDEAQDYSKFQFAVLKELTCNNSMTIVGDVGQGIYYYKGISQWEDLVRDIFDDNFKYVEITQSYRSTIEIIEFANEVLKFQENSLKPATPILRHGEKPKLVQFKTNREFGEQLDKIVEHVYSRNKKSIAVIGKDHNQCKKIRDYLRKYSKYKWTLIKDNDKNLKLDFVIIPSYMTKGLEFDCTVIYNCDEKNYGCYELDKKILYVALTRALHFEYIFYSGTISKLIK
ncbi:MAG: UvrD-helicase domain-containing protein [Clostridium sp.]|jgi:DNA helicase-2/ATP-dependent DNA helicase PcrA|uniref:RNA polymerase recycling motor HelD n=1 Tax=Clostridium sp. TaxID=1506 RepID=UPI0025C27DEB|nr:RNA polymerase recycling motor HelD [Clostridium sp.]MCH3963881.1 UvrD-helicase domain-containing protein [Clostridium sp.]MCI1717000.1 UvrD-helicase domain-containing protein [Clostridium sp.]MCI1801281.1 UvrD-helicase domain-containing protein [Clostridium sp.]MCI1815127.1 UvrD-helicase domain-containing protein [Clostridium sp.]MCI1872089.1 UvrD-helicase domain-containing protein [Clostridium sp.]